MITINKYNQNNVRFYFFVLKLDYHVLGHLFHIQLRTKIRKLKLNT